MDASAPERHQRDLRAIVRDGVAFSVMVGVGETYVPAFVLAAGLGEVSAGLVATLPMLVGACLQLATPAGVRRVRSHRRWVVLCAAVQALSFLPLIAGGLAGGIRREWVFGAAAVYWGFGMATGPAWNTWVGTLVPVEQRARFFAHRTRYSQAALFLAVVAAGTLLHHGAARRDALSVFALLFALATVARLLSARFLASQSEPVPLPTGHRTLRLGEFLRHLRHHADGRILLYLIAMQAGAHIAVPFFTPFMLGPLALSYGQFTALTATAFLARIAALPFLGRLVQRHGPVRVLRVAAVGITPLPSLWLVSHSFAYLLALQVVAGVAWAALELSTLLAFFERLREEERTSLLTFFNLMTALAIASGALLGSALFGGLGGDLRAYTVLFVASTLGRALAFGLVRGIPGAPGAHPSVELRTEAVRPSAGAIQRPILATLVEGDGPEAPRSGS